MRLVLDEDQQGAGGHRFHRAVGQLTKVFRGRTHEPVALEDAQLKGQLTAGVEQILRDITEDHLGKTALQSAETDQPIAKGGTVIPPPTYTRP